MRIFTLVPEYAAPRAFRVEKPVEKYQVAAHLERDSFDVHVYEDTHSMQFATVSIGIPAIEAILASDLVYFECSVKLNGREELHVVIRTDYLFQAMALMQRQSRAARKAADTRRQKAEQAKGGEA